MEFTSTSGGFSSRRSYPSLNHVSLAPLTRRFPIDDDSDTDALDYFNHRENVDFQGSGGTRTPPAPSYLASVSVPSTPAILSHSRSNSRTRHTHARSKSSTRSDTNLQSQNLTPPLHHSARTQTQTQTHKNQPSISSTQGRRQPPDTPQRTSKPDAEWMLRAGIALASSTREEKGQSWLTKRETSTSLDPPFDETATRHHKRTKSGASSRKSRSGASTPAGAFSRAASRRSSRRGSRVGLTMTSLPPTGSYPSTSEKALVSPGPGTGSATGTASPEIGGRSVLLPDFVDERIRAEMASLQNRRFGDEDSEYWDRDGAGSDDDDYDDRFSSEYSYGSDETPDDFDEADLQRLTRERGFGLGSWLDRLVEWTLFGVEELPGPAAAVSTIGSSRIGALSTTTTVTFEEPGLGMERGEEVVSLDDGDAEVSDDGASSRDGEGDGMSPATVEKPGTQGGWEDARWLLSVMKRALV
ncbi:hypothetical protein N7535_004598 [Penicillium sp. DV-2018c]|nr:hypothetical protein N7461_008178 [Penicillium sp. DV-2018c]KAJ5570938.1 hypothetical protein N7535_004598 [Penicillium sp. DV-2018c]